MDGEFQSEQDMLDGGMRESPDMRFRILFGLHSYCYSITPWISPLPPNLDILSKFGVLISSLMLRARVNAIKLECSKRTGWIRSLGFEGFRV